VAIFFMSDKSPQQILQLLQEVEQHVTKLKARVFKLEVDNKSLQDKIFDHLQTNSELKKELALTKEKAASANLSNIASKDITKDTKKAIDKYIKLIDKTIAKVQGIE
jgi:hypothetical protein